eukprot:scaffold110311_cov17-Tisochrysis_lutea.AAC.2
MKGLLRATIKGSLMWKVDLCDRALHYDVVSCDLRMAWCAFLWPAYGMMCFLVACVRHDVSACGLQNIASNS